MNRFLLALTALLLAAAPGAHAQSYSMTGRSFVQSPVALGMGDAGVAFPTVETVFFYNPAHIARAPGVRPHFTFLGASARISTGVPGYYTFYNDDLQPALDRGVENLSGAERETLYDHAFAIGRRRESAGADVVLPTVAFRVGPVGLGAGLFSNSGGQMQVSDAGSGIPQINFTAQSDVMGVATAGVAVAGLAVGASAKFTRRYLALKDKPLDAFSEDETVNVYRGNSVGVDVGALYTLGLPVGQFSIGAACFDIAGTPFEYAFERSLNSKPRSAALESDEIAQARALRQPSPQYRVGVGYQVPRLFGLLGATGVAFDYLGYQDPLIEGQPFLARVHMGAQVQLARVLAVRGGLSQGYPSVGAGLRLGVLRLDYTYFGQEEGRLPGQNASWHHQARILVGLF